VNANRAWLTLLLMSALFFMITGATFASLGLALPAMVTDLRMSWAEAGMGFSLLGVFCGITSTIPAVLIRRFGVRTTLLSGAATMAAAFLCLARAEGVLSYFAGASLAGLGFTLLATVPGTYLLTRLFARPSFAFGLYFTIGGLGGVAGPLLYFGMMEVSGDWRSYWLVAGALVASIGALAALLVNGGTDVSAAAETDPEISTESWDMRAALQTPQFWIIAAAYSGFLISAFTANSVSVAHLTQHGVTAVVAGSMMSVEALLNAAARLAGGVLVRFINARILLVIALACLIVGLLALGAARSLPMLLIYAAGIGIGFGLAFFASTILLLDYFGRRPYLELFAMVNLISTIAAVAPTLAGMTRDFTGGFVPFFVALSLLMGVLLLTVVMMRPPRKVAA
jgi:MFS family permease